MLTNGCRWPRSSLSPLRQIKGLFLHLLDPPWTDKILCSDFAIHVNLVVGMSQAHGQATASGQRAQAPQMGLPLGEQKNVQPSDQDTIALKGAGSQRHRNKQNLDYVVKSGLAGGLAGCAVCLYLILFFSVCALRIVTGQNSRWSSRPC